MGLIVDIYRSAARNTDCTNGGLSSRVTRLTVMNVDGPFDPDEEAPAAIIVPGPYETAYIVPAHKTESGLYRPEHGWFMDGGNFASTSDSRFGKAAAAFIGLKRGQLYCGALPIHDRKE